MPNTAEQRKRKDPSVVNNSINGFGICSCNSLVSGDIVIVIPNLGYGLLALTCARIGRSLSTVACDTGHKFIISTPETETPNTVTSGQEMLSPINGQILEMMTTRFKINSSCDTGDATLNNLVLPLPVKVKVITESDYVGDIRGASYATDIQELLLRWAYNISNNATGGSLEAIVQEAAASTILRSYSYVVGGSDYRQWTGNPIYDDPNTGCNRIESAQLYTDPLLGIEDILAEGVGDPTSNFFIRPFAAVYTNGGTDGVKRLYHVPDLDALVTNGMTVKGTSTVPNLTVTRTLHLLNGTGTLIAPSFGTVSDRAAAISLLGLDEEEYDILTYPTRGSEVISSTTVIPPIEGSVQYDYDGSAESRRSYSLYTLRPPIFTAGEYVIKKTATGPAQSILPFTPAYYLPIAAGSALQAESGACTYCGATGLSTHTRCLNCLSNAGWMQCPTCKGLDETVADAAERSRLSTGFTAVIASTSVDGETTSAEWHAPCGTCNPDNKVAGQEYRLGLVRCTECNGTGTWTPTTCPSCSGSLVSARTVASEAGGSQSVAVNLAALNGDGSVYTANINTSTLGFTPVNFAVFAGNRLLMESVTSPGGSSYEVCTVRSVTSGTTMAITVEFAKGEGNTVTHESLRQRIRPVDVLGDAATGTVAIYAFEADSTSAGAPYGFLWSSDINTLPMREVSPYPDASTVSIFNYLYINPDQATTYGDNGDNVISDAIGVREGFSLLAYTIGRYTDIIKGVGNRLAEIACAALIDITDAERNKGLLVSEDIPIIDTTFGNAKRDGILDGSLIRPDAPLTESIPREFSDPWAYSSADGITDYATWTTSLSKPTLAIVPCFPNEDGIFNHVIKDTAVALYGGTTSDMVAGKPVSIPLGEGPTVNETIDIINQVTPSAVDDSGYLSIQTLLSNAVGRDSQTSISRALDILAAIPNLCGRVYDLMGSTVVQVTPTEVAGVYTITTPAPMFSLNVTAEFQGEALSYDYEGTTYYREGQIPTALVRSVGNILSQGTPTGSSLDQDLNTRFQAARNALKNAIDNINIGSTDGNAMAIAAGDAETAIGDMLNVLSTCIRYLQNAESQFIYYDAGLTATKLYTRNATGTDLNDGVVLQLPDDDGSGLSYREKGLWFYNIRKSYLLLISLTNLIRALVEKAYFVVLSHRYSFLTMPCDMSLDSYDIPVNLSLYLGSDGESRCYPVIPSEIDLTTLSPTSVIINDITRIFPENSIYYDLTFSLPRAIDAQSDTITPLFMMGFGTSEGDFTSDDEYYWVKAPGLDAYGGVINAKFANLQGSISGYDYMTRSDGGSGEDDKITVKYFDENGDTQTAGTYPLNSDFTPLKDALYNGNTLDSIVLEPKPEIRSRIDVGYIFPYISSIQSSEELNLSLQVDFKPTEPHDISLPATVAMLGTVMGANSWSLLSSKVSDVTKTDLEIKKAVDGIHAILTNERLIANLHNNKDTARILFGFVGHSDAEMEDPSLYGESDLMIYTVKHVLEASDMIGELPINPDFADGTSVSKTKLASIITGTIASLPSTPHREPGNDTLVAGGTQNNWLYYDSLTHRMSFNYQWYASQKRAALVAHQVIYRLLHQGTSTTYTAANKMRVGDYDLWFVESGSVPSEVEYEGAMICQPFRCYGFGSLFGQASLVGTPSDTAAQRSVMLVGRISTSDTLPPLTVKSSTEGVTQVHAVLPIGQELYSGACTGVRLINFDNIYAPKANRSEDTDYGTDGEKIEYESRIGYNVLVQGRTTTDDGKRRDRGGVPRATAVEDQLWAYMDDYFSNHETVMTSVRSGDAEKRHRIQKTLHAISRGENGGWTAVRQEIEEYLKAAFLAGVSNKNSDLYRSISPWSLPDSLWLIIKPVS